MPQLSDLRSCGWVEVAAGGNLSLTHVITEDLAAGHRVLYRSEQKLKAMARLHRSTWRKPSDAVVWRCQGAFFVQGARSRAAPSKFM